MSASSSSSSPGLLKAILAETKNKRWDEALSDFPTVKAELEGSADGQRLLLLETVEWMKSTRGHHGEIWIVDELNRRLIQRKLPLIEEDLVRITRWVSGDDFSKPIGYALNAVERHTAEHGLSDSLCQELTHLRDSFMAGDRSSSEEQKIRRRIDAILGEEAEVRIYLDETEPWARLIFDNLHQLDDINGIAMRNLVALAGTASGSKPAAKWLKEAATIADEMNEELPRACLTTWIAAFGLPRTESNKDLCIYDAWSVAEANADMMKGLIWLGSRYKDDDLVRAISAAGLSGQKKIPGFGPRSAKVSNAAVWALSQIESPLAIGQLAIMRSKITNKSTQKVIGKAIETVAKRLNIPADEVEEMAVPTYGLTEVGMMTKQFGDFVAELIVTGTTSTELRWIKPDGKPQKTVPKAVRDSYADELKDLKAVAKDIQKILPAQRNRIDLLNTRQKTWTYPIWAGRYLNHPLMGTLARRLIWLFQMGEGGHKFEATWFDGRMVDVAGNTVEVDSENAIVLLWHAIDHDQDAIVAWRRFFEDREIQQPFKQAHREVYLLTDAERNTGTYSNRYASHVIKQHQYNALCGVRGWNNSLRLCVDDEYPPTFINLPEWNLRAEFWVEGIGDEYGTDTNETGTYHYLATDQVRFYSIDSDQLTAHAGGGGYGWGRWNQGTEPEPLPLDQIPALAFSEVMRDVDLFVGVASVGNDPNWQDGGPEGQHRDYWNEYSFGDLSATAETRREILERLVPRLKIADRCSFDEKFLIVRGDWRTYKIHLGSSNILMEPNDQYLCIVTGRGAGPGDKVFLPFEGDQRLAVILSKAMMLADDTRIKDPTILNQIAHE